MSAAEQMDRLYQGSQGYVSLDKLSYQGRQGARLQYLNPNPARMHAVDTTGMQEMFDAVSVLEKTQDLSFCIFHGTLDAIHAGADITEFQGECDLDAIHSHLKRGTSLDTRVKGLWPRMRTVGIFTGDRYGGSVEWPLFAEWGICDKDVRIQLSEVHLGIIPGWNGVLNVLLKCGPERARWMGQTGNSLMAADMLRMGIVQKVVATADPPDRSTPPEQWEAARSAYVEASEPLLMTAALDLATSDEAPVRNKEFAADDAGRQARQELLDSLEAELAARMDVSRYRALHDDIAREASALRKADDQDALKALGKKAVKDVLKLGKPLAPLAVKAVGKYVAEWSKLERREILADYEDIGQMEADLCASLMATEHRRIGVNAVLTREPADKVPVFA